MFTTLVGYLPHKHVKCCKTACSTNWSLQLVIIISPLVSSSDSSEGMGWDGLPPTQTYIFHGLNDLLIFCPQFKGFFPSKMTYTVSYGMLWIHGLGGETCRKFSPCIFQVTTFSRMSALAKEASGLNGSKRRV